MKPPLTYKDLPEYPKVATLPYRSDLNKLIWCIESGKLRDVVNLAKELGHRYTSSPLVVRCEWEEVSKCSAPATCISTGLACCTHHGRKRFEHFNPNTESYPVVITEGAV